MSSFTIKNPAKLRRRLAIAYLTAVALLLIAGPWITVAYNLQK